MCDVIFFWLGFVVVLVVVLFLLGWCWLCGCFSLCVLILGMLGVVVFFCFVVLVVFFLFLDDVYCYVWDGVFVV